MTRIPTPVPGMLALTEDAVWVGNVRGATVTHVDPATNTVVGASAVGYPLFGFALDGETGWATSHPRDRLLRLTPLP